MTRTIELIYDTLSNKRLSLAAANEKKEQHIKDLCSQQSAINGLSYDIERLETDLKNLHTMNTPVKMMGSDNGCSTLSAGVSEGPMSKSHNK
jgi:hypothetical protein